jgi:hypothetical protein
LGERRRGVVPVERCCGRGQRALDEVSRRERAMKGRSSISKGGSELEAEGHHAFIRNRRKLPS